MQTLSLKSRGALDPAQTEVSQAERSSPFLNTFGGKMLPEWDQVPPTCFREPPEAQG